MTKKIEHSDLGCAICDALADNSIGTLRRLNDEFKQACSDVVDNKLSDNEMLEARERISTAWPGQNTSISIIRNTVIVYVPRWLYFNESYCNVRVECEFTNIIRCNIESFLLKRVDVELPLEPLDRHRAIFRGDINFIYDKLKAFRFDVGIRFKDVIDTED